MKILFSLTLENLASAKAHMKISSPELQENRNRKKKNVSFLLVAIFACIFTSFCDFYHFYNSCFFWMKTFFLYAGVWQTVIHKLKLILLGIVKALIHI